MDMESFLDIRASGSASLAERGEQDEQGYWPSTPFLESGLELEDVLLSVSTLEDSESEINIELHKFHIAGEGGDRVFHMSLSVALGRAEQVALHKYLGFLLGLTETRG